MASCFQPPTESAPPPPPVLPEMTWTWGSRRPWSWSTGSPNFLLTARGKVQGLDELEGGGAQVEEPHKAIGRSDRHAGEARIHRQARQRGRAVDAALVHELPPLEIPNFEGSVVAHRDEVVRGLAGVKVHRIDLKGVALQTHHEALVVQVVDEDV